MSAHNTPDGDVYRAAEVAAVEASEEFAAWRSLVENHARHARLYLVTDSYQAASRWCTTRHVSTTWRHLTIATSDRDLFGMRLYPNDRLVRLTSPGLPARRYGHALGEAERMLAQLDEKHRAEVLELEAMTEREKRAADAARAAWMKEHGR